MNNKCFYIPSVINQNYFMLWKQDEIIFLMLPIALFFIIGGFTGSILALSGIIAMTMVIKSMGIDRRSGYMLHWLKFNIPDGVVGLMFSRKNKVDSQTSLFRREKAFPTSQTRHIAG